MATNKQDVLTRAYATLSSLRKNIDQMTEYFVEEKFVREFHTALDRLEGIEIDVSEFRIPDSAVKPKITARWLGGESHTEEKYVERSFILTKLDAILGYFEITLSEKPKRIGFGKSDA